MAQLQDRGKAMTPNDMIYNEIFKGCLGVGCNESQAKNAAIMGLQKYKNNQFTKPSALVQQCITNAKKLVIKQRK